MTEYGTFDPPANDPTYAITMQRAPIRPRVRLPKEWFHTIEGPCFDQIKCTERDRDLTSHGRGEPVGSRIMVFGRVTDSDGNPVRNKLVEIWQANAAGGYIDSLDVTGFALDPNFIGAGRCLTDHDGNYSFITIRPGPYPAFYATGDQGWRAAHIHFSLFGEGYGSRLITQMYFEGDPLLRQDRMSLAIPTERARDSLIGKLDLDKSLSLSFGPPRHVPTPDTAGKLVYPPIRTDEARLEPRNPSYQAFRFDIVLRGPRATVFENTEL